MASTAIKDGKSLTRGALAARTGCNIETIRYYEQIGMLPPAPRSEGGHRLYGPDLVKRLSFIRRSRDLGFTLDEVRELLRFVDGGKYTCEQVEHLAIEHVHEVDRKISDLRRLKRVLEAMISRCSGGEVPRCPIIDTLYDARTFPLAGASIGQGKRHSKK
ncbi:MerR family transcriptional regulator, mercuric resistance operon regulatory protein [Enhydrobacter aerosaccus]|uniref:MerR family transcriptional regulator, mercuric resistance operon regulatory protein n=1 Tax=Enhydrobacter aerosaccus TaxID=225324 RepID=A0A1T4S9T2_9HYPH|nr:helix-turn-helix domain-containing protein [Enhydrobacter aerosaccus]SKA25004.1 MerR family transcriptional regulator, mercuric resistance operon regulatory protein [Enhydrobacter aerosaccus]